MCCCNDCTVLQGEDSLHSDPSEAAALSVQVLEDYSDCVAQQSLCHLASESKIAEKQSPLKSSLDK